VQKKPQKPLAERVEVVNDVSKLRCFPARQAGDAASFAPGIRSVLPGFQRIPISIPMFPNLICGQWLPAAYAKTNLIFDPAGQTDMLERFPASHTADVDLGLKAACRAFLA
jgi:hypothetical protein